MFYRFSFCVIPCQWNTREKSGVQKNLNSWALLVWQLVAMSSSPLLTSGQSCESWDPKKKAAFPQVRIDVSASLLLFFLAPLRGEAGFCKAQWEASHEVPAAHISVLETNVGDGKQLCVQRQTWTGAGNLCLKKKKRKESEASGFMHHTVKGQASHCCGTWT